jgi:hypothetical protein
VPFKKEFVMLNSLLTRHRLPSALARRYHLTEPFSVRPGRGVFRAKYRPTRQERVLKLLPHGSADDAALSDRLSRLSAISYPNVVPLTSIGMSRTDPATCWVSTAYVPSVDLRELLRRVGPLTVEEVLCCAREALQGLRQFHERGLAHGAVHPSHLLAVAGRPSVLLLPTGGLTTWRPRAAELPARADDLVQLGDTLTLLLTGERLRDDSLSPQDFDDIVPRLEERQSGLSRPFLNWIGRLVDVDRTDRFRTATAALDALLCLRLTESPVGA